MQRWVGILFLLTWLISLGAPGAVYPAHASAVPRLVVYESFDDPT